MLALKYRPRRFADISGQPQVQIILRKMVELDRVPPLLLLKGTWGTGKTTTGRVLAAALNCSVSKPEPCGECTSCVAIFEERSLSVIEIDAASHGGVDDVRALQDSVRSSKPGVLVVLIDEAQSLTVNAQNALLKMFEDKIPDVHFVLLTTQPSKLLDTILSRAAAGTFPFRQIPPKAMLERLQYVCDQDGIVVEPELLARISQKAGGHLRDALNVLDMLSSVEISTLAEYSELFQETDFAPSMMAHMISGNHHKVAEILDYELSSHGDYRLVMSELISVLRDVLTLKLGGTIESTGQRQQLRHTLAAHMDQMRAVSALKLLWDLKVKLRADDPKSSIQLVSVLLTEALSGGTKPQVQVANPDKVMSMDDLRSFTG